VILNKINQSIKIRANAIHLTVKNTTSRKNTRNFEVNSPARLSDHLCIHPSGLPSFLPSFLPTFIHQLANVHIRRPSRRTSALSPLSALVVWSSLPVGSPTHPHTLRSIAAASRPKCSLAVIVLQRRRDYSSAQT